MEKENGSPCATFPSPTATSMSLTKKKKATKLSNKQGSSGKRRRAEDQDGGPVRPLSAYNFFFREERKRWLAERVGGPSCERARELFSLMGKEIGRRWKDLCPEDLSVYQGLAQQDSDRYQRERAEFMSKKQQVLAGEPSPALGDTSLKDRCADDIEKSHSSAVMKKARKMKLCKKSPPPEQQENNRTKSLGYTEQRDNSLEVMNQLPFLANGSQGLKTSTARLEINPSTSMKAEPSTSNTFLQLPVVRQDPAISFNAIEKESSKEKPDHPNPASAGIGSSNHNNNNSHLLEQIYPGLSEQRHLEALARNEMALKSLLGSGGAGIQKQQQQQQYHQQETSHCQLQEAIFLHQLNNALKNNSGAATVGTAGPSQNVKPILPSETEQHSATMASGLFVRQHMESYDRNGASFHDDQRARLIEQLLRSAPASNSNMHSQRSQLEALAHLPSNNGWSRDPSSYYQDAQLPSSRQQEILRLSANLNQAPMMHLQRETPSSSFGLLRRSGCPLDVPAQQCIAVRLIPAGAYIGGSMNATSNAGAAHGQDQLQNQLLQIVAQRNQQQRP